MTDKEQSRAAKDYLCQISKIDKLINRLLSTVATLRSGLTSQSYELKPDKIQTSGPKDPIGETFARISELEAEMNSYIDELVDLKKAIFSRIRRIPDQEQQNILIARYIEGEKWEAVAVAINFSIRQVTRIHGAALISFAQYNKDVLECPSEKC